MAITQNTAASPAVAPAANPPPSHAAGATFPRTIQQRAAYAARRSEALNDWAVLEDMKRCLRQHLSAALAECSALSRDLKMLDPDVVMPGLRQNFDAHDPNATIQDAFSDGFHDAVAAVIDAGGEPVSARKMAPSGVAAE